MNCKQA